MAEPKLDTDKLIEQNFARAEKTRQQDFVHINRRLDNVHRRFDDLNQSGRPRESKGPPAS